MLSAEEAVRRIESAAYRAHEEGTPLSPLLIIGILHGTVVIPEKPRPLSHDLPDHPVG
jgi:hypothetical protein